MLTAHGRAAEGEPMPANDAAAPSPSVQDLQRRVDELAAELRQRTSDHEEALRREAAVAEILQVTNASGGDLVRVFDAIIEKATRLCSASYGYIWTYDGESVRPVAVYGDERFGEWLLQRGPVQPWPESPLGRALRSKHPIHVLDATEEEAYRSRAPFRDQMDRAGIRTMLHVCLRKDGRLLGAITVYRRERQAFTDQQVRLLESFAEQAVIAMENARLLGDLQESLGHQTATSDVLKVISRSTFDLQPVLQMLAETAIRLCNAETCYILHREGEAYRSVATAASPEALADAVEYQRYLGAHPLAPGRGSLTGRVALAGQVVHIADVTSDPEYTLTEASTIGRIRTQLGLPLMREGSLIGVMALGRQRVEPFSERQIDLLRTFADQAVIAIENTRLLTEQREALEQQTATAEVLQAINSSPGNLTPVFDAMLDKATRLSEAAFAHVADLAADEYQERAGFLVRQGLSLGGFRTVLAVPMRKDASLLGAITIYRREVQLFSDKQIALLQSFAAQAVIAMENARLLRELRQRQAELARSVDELTATGDVLKIISRSTFELQLALDTLVSTAARLCETEMVLISRREGDQYRSAAAIGFAPEFQSFMQSHPLTPGRGSIVGRVALEKRVIQIEDVTVDPDYTLSEAISLSGQRSALGVPLLREDDLIGVIVLARRRVEPFTDRQIELMRTFADQAVIAMENTRLLGELTRREEELRVTFDHMGDGVVMFDAGLRLASWNRNFQELLDIPDSFLAGRPGLEDYVRLLVGRGELGEADADNQVTFYRERASQHWSTERIRPDGRVIEVRNNPVPGGGVVLIYSDITERKKAEAEIATARDAAEAALERQTATADILKVIASSPTDVQPVLDAVAKAAQRFCGAEDTLISLREDDEIIWAAHEGSLTPVLGRGPFDRNSISGRTVVDSCTIHLPDMGALGRDEMTNSQTMAAASGTRAALAAPMLREGVAVGCILLRKREPGAFTPQQIELLETFAAQAVIAIQNVRLFTELGARNRELTESLEQQTATAEILRVISQSPTNVQPVLDVVANAARRFCGATDAIIVLRDDNESVTAAHEGPIPTTLGLRRPIRRSSVVGRAIIDGSTVHVADISQVDSVEYADVVAISAGEWRATVAAPMMREGNAIGSIALRRAEAGPFSDRQVELLETFAAQAVIAIENVRLFTELRDSLERLKAAQANLIQSEKMASLGQLTAGIAHEIKNPLNFVNNFAGLSVELLDELKQAAAPALEALDADQRAEVNETIELLTGNLDKIAEHGMRADGIVRSMLSHSRGGKGDWQESNINALVEEALNLAYHGARAQDKEFNVTLERDFAPEAGPIDVVPQDLTRVFLNLFGNGFYAATKRRLGGANAGYRPTLKVSTRDLGDLVEVRVRDNGTGIPPEVRDKLFQPFFTTKPTGEGTGLGLSISYDIVTQQHGGTIKVESEPGSFTEFTVRLPRGRRVVQPGGA
jgi:PAS domain S-box-containing protein